MSRIHTTLFALTLVLLLPWHANAEPVNEVELIQEHLASVEAHLRTRDVSDWPEELQEARAARLDELRQYRLAGEFPLNTRHPEARTPYFIDDYGTACAVGHLMIESGGEKLARKISREENHAYVMEMQTPGLASWVESSGITAEEAAWIQPGYSFCEGVLVDQIQGPTEANCGERIELQAIVTSPQDCPADVRWTAEASDFPPDAIVEDELQTFADGEIVFGDTVNVQFDPEQHEDHEFIFTALARNMQDSDEREHRVRVDCGEPGWDVEDPVDPDPDPDQDPEPSDPDDSIDDVDTDESTCSTVGATPSFLVVLIAFLGFRLRRTSRS